MNTEEILAHICAALGLATVFIMVPSETAKRYLVKIMGIKPIVCPNCKQACIDPQKITYVFGYYRSWPDVKGDRCPNCGVGFRQSYVRFCGFIFGPAILTKILFNVQGLWVDCMLEWMMVLAYILLFKFYKPVVSE